MPNCRAARVVVLCEDTRHYHFIRGFLKAKGIGGGKVRPRIAPPGGGSAEQFVRTQFPRELKAHRRRHGNVLLIACIDQDRPACNRVAEFEEACRQDAVPLPTQSDRLLLLVPTRNIETWLYLIEQDAAVDESTDYKPQCRLTKPGKLGRRLANVCPDLPLPPSLDQAKRDWHRLCG